MNKIFLFLFLCIFLLAGCGQDKVILPNGTEIKVEIASTPQQAERGLMFRQRLDDSSGMLFVFEKDDLRLFWMKNTLIDLDIIFINSKGEIVNIEEQVPHSYIGAPEEEIAQVLGWGKYVLEINAASAQKYNLKQGDRLTLKIK